MNLNNELKNITFEKIDLETIYDIKQKILEQIRLREPENIGKKITCPREAFEELKSMADEEDEFLKIIYISAKNEIIKKEILTKGTDNQTLISNKHILKKAIMLNGLAGIIIAHNHPTGICEPSSDDKNATSVLKNACKLLDIHLIDHMIITNNGYFSFMESGIL